MDKATLRNSAFLKLLIIGALIVILLIPSFMISGLITERKNRRDSAQEEVSEKWGSKQTLTGPVITIPYKYYTTNKSGERDERKGYANFLPDTLIINGDVNAQVRYRGIYEVVLYNGKFSVSGQFKRPDFGALGIAEDNVMWDRAEISFGVSDMKGIKDLGKFNFNNKEYDVSPGLKSFKMLSAGFTALPDFNTEKEKNTFSFDISLNGSKEISFVPAGKETKVKIKSNWANPSFTGNFLPVERSISEEGFTSQWKVLHYNRNFSQSFTDRKFSMSKASFGVMLRLEVDEYQKTERTSKYAIMFIALTFLAFFIIEIINGKNVHPIQYLLIGFALILFYTLLLSFSEYMLFMWAYILAAIMTVAMVSLYTFFVLNSKKFALFIFSILVLLYGYLYILMQLQDLSLLLGSIGLFISLAAVMYLTRNINWYELSKEVKDKI